MYRILELLTKSKGDSMIDDELKTNIRKLYQDRTSGSIQDIARLYRVDVSTVLEIIGEGDLSTVQTGGDLIDATEAGPGADMNYGRQFNVPFSTD